MRVVGLRKGMGWVVGYWGGLLMWVGVCIMFD